MGSQRRSATGATLHSAPCAPSRLTPCTNLVIVLVGEETASPIASGPPSEPVTLGVLGHNNHHPTDYYGHPALRHWRCTQFVVVP